MSVAVTSGILASIVAGTVAIAILFRRPRRPVYLIFSAFSASLFLWQAASVANRLADGTLQRWPVIAALLIPPTAVLFFRDLLRQPRLTERARARLYLLLSLLLILLNASPWGEEMLLPSAVAATYVFSALALVLHSLYRHTQKARSETERRRLNFLFYSGFLTLLLAAGELLPDAGLAAALGHVAATFYVYFLYQSIISHRLIDLVELLGKAAVLAVLTLVLATVYALLLLWVGTGQQGLWLFNTLVASFVILILYDPVRPWVEEATAKLLFRERYELRLVVKQLLRRLRTTISLDAMREQVLNALSTSGRAKRVAIYLQNEEEASFRLFGYRGDKPPGELSTSRQPSLVKELRRERRPYLLEHLTVRQQELPTLIPASDPTLQRELERTAEAIEAMRSVGANVLIPMLVDDRILGLLCLGADHVVESFSADELASLLSLAEACAVVIENSQEYEKRRERDRLVAVGEMATGMAHEIRNPLGAIKGAAQCLDPATLPREAEEFVDVIIEEVDRLSGVVAQFLEYARPYRGDPVLVSTNEVVAATLKLLQRDAIPETIKVQQDLAHMLPKISVDPEQLKQVLINLILNAVQAMPKGGSLKVHTGLSHRPVGRPGRARVAHDACVIIRVEDSGVGISPEDLASIFVPFFTTKARGTGLGLPISQRIVENAGGQLEVVSRQGRGTSFTIRVPAAEGVSTQDSNHAAGGSANPLRILH